MNFLLYITIFSHNLRAINLSHVLHKIDHSVGITPLVIVPRDELDEVVGEGNSGLGIEDGGKRAGLEVVGDDILLGVTENTLEGGLGGELDGSLDVLVGGGLLEGAGEIDDGDILGGDTEGHTSELTVELRNDLTDGLGGTGGGRNDVVASRSATSPVLLGRTIEDLLGGGDGVDGGHETLLEAKVVVDDLGERSETVGGAGSVGDNLQVLGVFVVVDTHDEHGSSLLGRSRDDDLLGASLEVSSSLLTIGEDTGGLRNVLGTSVAPRNLSRGHGVGDLDLVAVDPDAVLVGLDLTLEATVGGVVLDHVLHVSGINEGIVDGDDIDHGVGSGGTEDETTDTTETVDTNVDGTNVLDRGVGVADVNEGRSEGSTTDEETIDIGLLGRLHAVLGVDGTTVDDTDLLGDVGGDVVSEPLSEGLVDLLSLGGGGDLAGTDGPDGLVGNDDVVPVLDGVGVGLELSADDSGGLAGLSLLEGLTEAGNDLDAVLESVGGLLGDLGVGLALGAALGVTDDGPVDLEVLQHLSGGLTSEGTVALGPAILSSDGDVGADGGDSLAEVGSRGGDDDLGVVVEGTVVEVTDNVLDLSDGTVALPVAANEELAARAAEGSGSSSKHLFFVKDKKK